MNLGPSPYAQLDRPLLDGDVPPPKNDQEAVALIQKSKAAIDHQTQLHQGAHPAVKAAFEKAKQKHVDAVVSAIHTFHDKHPSPLSERIVDAIHSDPNLKTSHPRPASKKP